MVELLISFSTPYTAQAGLPARVLKPKTLQVLRTFAFFRPRLDSAATLVRSRFCCFISSLASGPNTLAGTCGSELEVRGTVIPCGSLADTCCSELELRGTVMPWNPRLYKRYPHPDHKLCFVQHTHQLPLSHTSPGYGLPPRLSRAPRWPGTMGGTGPSTSLGVSFACGGGC